MEVSRFLKIKQMLPFVQWQPVTVKSQNLSMFGTFWCLQNYIYVQSSDTDS